MFAAVVTLLFLFQTIDAFTSSSLTAKKAPRVKPIHENFFLDIAEDPAINTPREIFGEVSYKQFVKKVVPDGLLSREYKVIERVRELKLLSLTAESGILEALEKKGLTLSQIEKLLPLVDNLNLLPLAAENKGLLLALAPFIIEPAPLLLPIIASILTSPSNIQLPGAFLLASGVYEVTQNNAFLAAPLILLGIPLAGLGIVLSGSVSVPTIQAATAEAVFEAPSSPVAAKISFVAPQVTTSAVAREPEKAPLNPLATANVNGRRKLVKINKRN